MLEEGAINLLARRDAGGRLSRSHRFLEKIFVAAEQLRLGVAPGGHLHGGPDDSSRPAVRAWEKRGGDPDPQ